MPIVKIIAIIVIPVSLFFSGIFYKKFTKIKQDNIVEEIIEDFVKENTGVSIDISPDTPENDKEKDIFDYDDPNIEILLESKYNKLYNSDKKEVDGTTK